MGSFRLVVPWPAGLGTPWIEKMVQETLAKGEPSLLGVVSLQGTITFWTHQKGRGGKSMENQEYLSGRGYVLFFVHRTQEGTCFFLKWECTSLKTNMDPGYICIYVYIPKMMDLEKVDSGLKYGHFWCLYVRFLGCTLVIRHDWPYTPLNRISA